MDFPVQVLDFQLAQEWADLMRAFLMGLTWMAVLGALAILLGSVVEASCSAVRSRRFWCPSIGRDVQVQFDECGPPGFRHVLRVVECSAFEPPSAIACRRVCRDATCRRPGAPFELSGLRA